VSLLRDVLYKHLRGARPEEAKGRLEGCAITQVLDTIWYKTTARVSLTVPEKIFFYVLCFFELFYRAIFFVITIFKRALVHNKRTSFFYVISVGNLSVGGTGKSVFVQFLVHALQKRALALRNEAMKWTSVSNGSLAKSCAIALRGYKSKLEKTGESFLVHDGITSYYDVTETGDEAYMLAQNLQVPIVIGPNRAKSCDVLEKFYKNIGAQEKSYLILDDAYRHTTLKKNLEILLLDARHPFENNHCLPAGRLREKDYTRADIIILTHADAITTQALDDIKKNKLKKFDQTKIFSGKHVTQGIYYHNQNSNKNAPGSTINFSDVYAGNIKKQVLVFAGIGSFSNFVHTVKQSKINPEIIISQTIEYQDHHAYTKNDLEKIIQVLEINKLDCAITTSKDWCKLEPIINQHNLTIPIYVLRVGFEFLSTREYDNFMRVFVK